MPKGRIRHFTELVGMLNRGTFHQHVNKEIDAVIAALEGLPGGKGKGTVTVKLDFIYENGLIDVKPEVVAKEPKNGFAGNRFWAIEGELSVNHPQQADMFRDDAD